MDNFLLICCLVIAAALAAISGCDQGSVNPTGTSSPVFDSAPVSPAPQPAPLPTPAPTQLPPTPPTGPVSAQAQQVLLLTNQFRAANGVVPLAFNPNLATSAHSFAELMAQLDFFSHNSPDGTTPAQRIEAAGYTGWTTWGENIAEGYTTPEDVMSGWISSPGHKANLLNPAFRDLGVGYSGGAKPYWVQDFGTR